MYANHSVYCIAFADGAAYVGITGGLVEDRVEQHLGADPWGSYPTPPIAVAEQHGLGTPAIVRRVAAGVAYTVKVLASGLTERQARAVEYYEIGKLDKPLNAAGPVKAWRDPLAPDPVRGPVARRRYKGAITPPSPRLRPAQGALLHRR